MIWRVAFALRCVGISKNRVISGAIDDICGHLGDGFGLGTSFYYMRGWLILFVFICKDFGNGLAYIWQMDHGLSSFVYLYPISYRALVSGYEMIDDLLAHRPDSRQFNCTSSSSPRCLSVTASPRPSLHIVKQMQMERKQR